MHVSQAERWKVLKELASRDTPWLKSMVGQFGKINKTESQRVKLHYSSAMRARQPHILWFLGNPSCTTALHVDPLGGGVKASRFQGTALHVGGDSRNEDSKSLKITVNLRAL